MKLTEEQIERLRQTGIRLDREGRFWHEGEEVLHGGFRRALLRWLDILPDGRSILRLDEHRFAYVDVDDAFLLGVSARWEDDHLIVKLNDDSEAELDYATLSIEDGGAYFMARGGKLRARLITPAYQVLAQRLEETSSGEVVLRAAGRAWKIA